MPMREQKPRVRNRGEHLMVEAGTGTGKSIRAIAPAKLLPVNLGLKSVA